MAEEGHGVTLNVYDLSQGLASTLSMSFLGKTIEGICFSPPVTPNVNKPSPATPAAPMKTAEAHNGDKKVTKEEQKMPTTTPAKVESASSDPLGDARSKVQEEIMAEFAVLMASGSLRASKAAALATRRVMQRYGNPNLAVQQS